jgi:acyl-CoA thioester hydrolase
MAAHIYTLRVYHQDTDAMGVAHHSNYLNYFERARTEALREMGFDLVSMSSKYDTQFALRSIKLDFLQPARLDQVLVVVSEIETLRQASLIYDQKIYLEKPGGTLLCQAKIRLACIDNQFRPRGVPEKLAKGVKECLAICL